MSKNLNIIRITLRSESGVEIYVIQDKIIYEGCHLHLRVREQKQKLIIEKR